MLLWTLNWQQVRWWEAGAGPTMKLLAFLLPGLPPLLLPSSSSSFLQQFEWDRTNIGLSTTVAEKVANECKMGTV